jgi:hypothetical protein
MENLRSGVQDLLNSAWKTYFDITGGRKFATKKLDNFRDSLNDDTWGYSFIDENQVTERPYEFFSFLVKEKNLATLDGEGRLSWNEPAIHRFFLKTAELNRHLSVLCYILPTISNRVTQFIDQKIRNDVRPRNLHMLGDEMFFLVRYHKMTNLTGLDTCIPAFVPQQLTEILIEYLCVCRGAEQILTRIVHQEPSVSNYFT